MVSAWAGLVSNSDQRKAVARDFQNFFILILLDFIDVISNFDFQTTSRNPFPCEDFFKSNKQIMKRLCSIPMSTFLKIQNSQEAAKVNCTSLLLLRSPASLQV